MGGSKSSGQSSGSSQQTTTVTPTAEETELNRLRLEREKSLDPSIRRAQQQGLDLSSLLLTGGSGGRGLPGFLQPLPGGISESVTQDIVNQALGDVRAGLQTGGLLDSGVRQELEARTAADIRTQSAQFNLQNLQQLLNLAVGGQAVPLQSPLGFGSLLSQSLAGLRSTNTSGTFNQRTQTVNPFLTGSNIMQGIGTGIGVFGALCWVASEIFGGWFAPKTCATRAFMQFKAPMWLRNLYIKYGERFAKFIRNKPIIKALLRPIFEVFAWLGGE